MFKAALPALTGLILFGALVAAPPPPPPADFATPESPKKPAPFEVKYVDQGTFDPKLKGLYAPEGFKTELVADERSVINPVGLTFAPDGGTLYVIEWAPDPGREWYEFKETFHYRDGTKKAVATMKKFTPDPVKRLTFDKSTNTYTKSEVIFTDELPSTLLYHDGWLYTASRGTVRRYRQGVPGGKWDIRETIAQGFCGFHHHQVSGLTMGPDGYLYITSGDDDNFAEGSDGTRATVLRTGAIFRCLPDGSKLEEYSRGYRNPYRDIAIDDKGQFFHADNDNEDGSRFTGCRLVHVAEDVDYGWRLLEGARCCRPDHTRGAVAGELPGKLPPMLKTGRGSPAGVLLYHDTQLPEQYRGLMYYPDVFRRVVRAYKMASAGSSFAITHEFEFLKSDDPLFRPCQMVTGPDGAIYVCDWRTDSGGAGKLWGDGKHGRIYRMSWVGTKDQPAIPLRAMDTWAVFANTHSPMDNLIAGIRCADVTTRRLALEELILRAEKKPDDIRKLFVSLTDNKEPLPTRILATSGLLAVWNEEAQTTVVRLTSDKNPDVRRTALDTLARKAKTNFAVEEAVARRLLDETVLVRRSAALAVGRLHLDGLADNLVNAILADDKKDPFLSDAYLRGLERLGNPGLQALLRATQSGDNTAEKKLIPAFTGLRSRLAADMIPELLINPHLDGQQKASLIRSYMNYQFDPPYEPLKLLTHLTNHPDDGAEVNVAGLEVLAAMNALGTEAGAMYVGLLLDSKDDDTRLAAWNAVETNSIVSMAPKLGAVAKNESKSQAERIAAIRAGRTMGDASFAAVLKDFLADSKSSPAIKVESLRTLTVREPGAAQEQAKVLLDQVDPTVLGEAIAVLGSTKAGAKLVGERYLAKKLPRDFFPRVSDVLRKYQGDEAIAKLNTEVLRGGLLLSMQPDQVEKIRKDVQSKGDPNRGKAIYLNTSLVSCSTCHKLEGVGGQVGPDLTRVWDTMTTEKLLESMVSPSKEIKEGYQTFTALTLEGQSYSGLKVTDTATEVVIREATGRDIKIVRKDLDVLKSSNQSLMPDNVVSQLSYAQFLDLLAFLKSQKEQESLRGRMLDGLILTGLPKDLKTSELEAKLDFTSQQNGKSWLPIAANPSGVLPVKPMLTSDSEGYLIASAVYSPKKQTVNLAINAEDPIRISIIGNKVFERDVPKQRALMEAEMASTELPAGWSVITIRAYGAGPNHNVGLQFSGEGLRTAAKPEK
jgi:quinoprotein glucose dehydrogenase